MSDRTLKCGATTGGGSWATGRRRSYDAVHGAERLGCRDVASISYASTLVLLSNGTVLSWGLNNLGQLGNGTKTNSATPTAIPNLSGVAAIAGGSTADTPSDRRVVKAWGNNDEGRSVTALDDAIDSDDGLRTLRRRPISTAQKAAYALLSDGTVKAWGRTPTASSATARRQHFVPGDGAGTRRTAVTSLAVASTSSQDVRSSLRRVVAVGRRRRDAGFRRRVGYGQGEGCGGIEGRPERCSAALCDGWCDCGCIVGHD